jgi:multiple sugar transport system ATP-binding protein
VVMKLGLEQEQGIPQDVYNNPSNRFVANFLGTPPINFFNGEIKGNKVFVGKEMVREITEKSLQDQPVTVGIRPEGIIPDNKGPLSLDVERIVTMGRDIMLVAQNPFEQRPEKYVIDAFEKVGIGRLKATVKPHKCFAFSKQGDEEKLI